MVRIKICCIQSIEEAALALGGTGRRHDWAVSRVIVSQVRPPVFLAGARRPENLRSAGREVRPFGVDLSSGVRRNARLDTELPGGRHRLQLIMGGHNHLPHGPPGVSDQISITVTRQERRLCQQRLARSAVRRFCLSRHTKRI
jgi:hypothetical protein